MYEKVFHVVLNKIGKFLCVVEQTQNYRFYRFFRYFIRKQCYRRKKYGRIRHQRLQIDTKRCFVFSFTQILILTVIFAILVGHIGLKKKRKTLICNPKLCHELKNMICQFEEIYHKPEGVRVPQKKSRKKPL